MNATRLLLALALLGATTAVPARACDPEDARAAAVREAEQAVRDAARDLRRAEHDAAMAARRDAFLASRDEREAAQEAATAAARDAVRAARLAEIDRLRAELRRLAGLRSGVVVAPGTLMYIDGPEVPLDGIEWADGSAARRLRHAMLTDTVLHVDPGVRLALANMAGDIVVGVWDRNEVRILADHDRDDQITSELKDNLLTLKVRPREGEPSEVGWKLTVPSWLPLELSGMESEIAVSGMRSPVHAQSMRGDVVVSGCRGPLEVNSLEGEVHVMDVSGNVSAGSVNNAVRIVRVTGPVEAQTINGDIQLEKLASSSVEASTVNGHVYYASPFRSNGRYAFSSHNGKVFVGVPTDQRVNVKVASFNGQVQSSVPMPGQSPERHALKFGRGRAVRFTTGEAPEAPEGPDAQESPRAPSAPRAPQLDLESFGGLIQLASQEEVLRAIERQRVALDKARAALLRARREVARARRRESRDESAPTPDTPPPPPTPHP